MILNRKRVGLLLRTFATKAEDVPKRVAAIEKMVDKATKLQIEGRAVFSRIDVLVWADARYKDADCGDTAEAMKLALAGVKGVHVTEFKTGDLFCGILNFGVAHQLRDRIDYTLIASTEAESYFNPETVGDMLVAMESGAKAAGVAINELTQSVCEGRLANTMAMWDNLSLMSVGGFDLRAAKPVNDQVAHYLRGWSEDAGQVFYQLAGVEEIIPLARLVEIYGPCLAPIMPRGEGVQTYQTPDPVTQLELWVRHVSKMGTKLERQAALAAAIGYVLAFLKGGVMPAYRR